MKIWLWCSVVVMSLNLANAALCSTLTTLTEPSGQFNDGSGIGTDYEANSVCGWLISPDAPVTQIALKVLALDLDTGDDRLLVYDGTDDSAPLLHTYSGTDASVTANIVSSGNRMYIKFTSDAVLHANGFTASYFGLNSALNSQVTYINHQKSNCACEQVSCQHEPASCVVDDGTGKQDPYPWAI